MPFVWRGEKFKRRLKAHYIRVLDTTRVEMEGDAKKLVGKRAGKGSHSKVGQPPFRQKSDLINSITSSRKGLTAKIGSTIQPSGGHASYPLILELGLSQKLGGARPWLRPTLKKHIAKFRRKLKFRGR